MRPVFKKRLFNILFSVLVLPYFLIRGLFTNATYPLIFVAKAVSLALIFICLFVQNTFWGWKYRAPYSKPQEAMYGVTKVLNYIYRKLTAFYENCALHKASSMKYVFPDIMSQSINYRKWNWTVLKQEIYAQELRRILAYFMGFHVVAIAYSYDPPDIMELKNIKPTNEGYNTVELNEVLPLLENFTDEIVSSVIYHEQYDGVDFIYDDSVIIYTATEEAANFLKLATPSSFPIMTDIRYDVDSYFDEEGLLREDALTDSRFILLNEIFQGNVV